MSAFSSYQSTGAQESWVATRWGMLLGTKWSFCGHERQDTDMEVVGGACPWSKWETGERNASVCGCTEHHGNAQRWKQNPQEAVCKVWSPDKGHGRGYFSMQFFFFNFIFKLYIIVLVLPNIKMNPPQVYMCSPSWTLLPPPCSFYMSQKYGGWMRVPSILKY